MAAIADVNSWWTAGGIHHVVAWTNSGTLLTLCGCWTFGLPDEFNPKKLRLCQKCRERLPEAKVKRGDLSE